MNDLLNKMFPEPPPETPNEMLKLLRQMMQSLALLGLWRARFFEHAAFYGGTAIRILYGLDRFSEDLDFSLLKPSSGFSFEAYGNALQKELKAFGFQTSFAVKQKSVKTAIESAFLKGNTYDLLLHIKTPETLTRDIHQHSEMKIRLEVDTDPPPGFETEMKYVFFPVQFAVRVYDLPSLFAGKMHALLCRNWKNRVKGRDWYDFLWYIGRHPAINLSHLEERMRQTGHYTKTMHLTRQDLLNMVHEKIEGLDVDKARDEVMSFVEKPTTLDIWSKDFFKAAVEKIIIK